MDLWAKSGKYDCNFLCICVVGDRSAKSLSVEFANELKLQHCINSFIDNRGDMPEYGQLGCNGFIVLDADHKVPPHPGVGIAIKGDAWVSGWFPAAAEIKILRKAYSSQTKLVSF